MEEASEHRQGNEAAANIPKLHADLGWSTQMSTNGNHPWKDILNLSPSLISLTPFVYLTLQIDPEMIQ